MAIIKIFGDFELIKFVRQARSWLFWSGLLLIVIGFIAVIYPVFATTVTELFIGWLFIISGFLNFITALSYKNKKSVFGRIVMSLFAIITGVFLISNLSAGTILITILIAVLFIIDGIFGFYISLMRKPLKGWLWIFISAIASIIIGVMIAANLPSISISLLGFIVGLNFIISGLSCVFLAKSIDSDLDW